MSIRVALDELASALEGVGDTCFLLTTNDDQSPHPAHVPVHFVDGSFVVAAGKRSTANGSDRPMVTLLWPAGGDDGMHLLVDGTARVESADGGTLVVEPTGAIWHRQPD